MTTGGWTRTTWDNVGSRYGGSFMYANGWTNDSAPNATATYTFDPVTEAGNYDFFAWWTAVYNRATNTPYTILVNGEEIDVVRVNQQIDDARWNLLGNYALEVGDVVTIVISNNANQYVVADAVKIALHEEEAGFTPQQELAIFVAEMAQTDTSKCVHPIYVQEFKDELEEARELSRDPNLTEEEAIQAKEDLQAAYDNVMAWLKGDNLALKCPVTASESMNADGAWLPKYLTDGFLSKSNVFPVGYSTNVHRERELEEPITLTIDLGEVKEFNSVSIYPRLGSRSWEGKTANFPADYELQISSDGVNFETICAVEDQPDPNFLPVDLEFDPVEARYVRLSVTKLGQYAGDEHAGDTPYRLQLSEIEVYNLPARYSVDLVYEEDYGAAEGYTGKLPDDGIELTFTAEPNPGYVFDGWYVDDELVETELAYTFILKENVRLEARFVAEKSGLQDLMEEMTEDLDEDDYTEESWQNFQDALEYAQKVLDDDSASQEEVAEAIDLLQKAYDDLEREYDWIILPGFIGNEFDVDFDDVSKSDWYYDAVEYVVGSELMKGVSDGKFAPEGVLSRGMVAQILYNLDDVCQNYTAEFPDVTEDDWFYYAAAWASYEGVMKGYSDGRFGGNDPVTREQLATTLYRYAQDKGWINREKADLSRFPDGGKTSDWARAAMEWAVGNGLINGDSKGNLNPTGTATRSQVAQIIMNFCENIA